MLTECVVGGVLAFFAVLGTAHRCLLSYRGVSVIIPGTPSLGDAVLTILRTSLGFPGLGAAACIAPVHMRIIGTSRHEGKWKWLAVGTQSSAKTLRGNGFLMSCYWPKAENAGRVGGGAPENQTLAVARLGSFVVTP